jgi:chaperone required for assembly of F1-ATPase
MNATFRPILLRSCTEMAEWAPKRFWKAAQVTTGPEGFGVALDGRPVRTPAKAALTLPSEAMAVAIAAEWEAQQGVLRPETMPMTRMANSAIDKVRVLQTAVVAEIAGFGASDLLCYRAAAPEDLALRQRQGWDPLLDWAATRLQAPLNRTEGIMPVAQPAASLDLLTRAVAAYEAFRLTALHDLVAITGSLVLGLAISEHRLSPDQAWALARIDEDWQAEQWGADEEAAAQAAHRRQALLDAARFLGLCP